MMVPTTRERKCEAAMERYIDMRGRMFILLLLAVLVVAIAAACAPAEKAESVKVNEEATESTGTKPNQLDEYDREEKRLKSLATSDLRAEIDGHIEKLKKLYRVQAKQKDEEKVASLISDQTFDLSQAYWALDHRGEITKADEAARLRFVDIPADREFLDLARDDRKRYLRDEYDPDSADSRDQLAILKDDVEIGKIWLAQDEALLRIAERQAKADGGRSHIEPPEAPEEAEGISV